MKILKVKRLRPAKPKIFVNPQNIKILKFHGFLHLTKIYATKIILIMEDKLEAEIK